jgi:endonuclease YncB( thermonuclease family)
LRGSSAAEKKHAIVARDALSERILDKYVNIKNVSTEKYGRLLADVYFKETNMNDWMVSNNYAVEYDGGTKLRDKSWDK